MPIETTIQKPQQLNGAPPRPTATLPEQEDAWMGILSRRPPWVVRWGITIFFLMVMGLLGISWFIRYPDRVTAQGKLLAINPPQALVARIEGRLQHLQYNDGDNLKKGELIAVLESTTEFQAALKLKAIADSLLWLAQTNQSHLVPSIYARLSALPDAEQLGTLQNSYQPFMAALQSYTQYIGKGYFLQQRHMLGEDLKNIAAQEQVINAQLSLTSQEIELAAENFKVSETLSNQKVIAPVEYRNEAGKWLNKQQQLPQLKNNQLANTAQRLEKLKQIVALENEIAQQKAIFMQALQNWLAAIAAWELQYLVHAPCQGKLVLSSFYNPGRYVRQGEMLGNVQPPNTGYFLEANLPQYNFGKLSIGQKTIVRFAAYPSEEFGMVTGTLDAIKPVPTDSGYIAKILLPQGLTTHLSRKLAYREGLQANVEIITDDRRLLERFFSGIRKAVQR